MIRDRNTEDVLIEDDWTPITPSDFRDQSPWRLVLLGFAVLLALAAPAAAGDLCWAFTGPDTANIRSGAGPFVVSAAYDPELLSPASAVVTFYRFDWPNRVPAIYAGECVLDQPVREHELEGACELPRGTYIARLGDVSTSVYVLDPAEYRKARKWHRMKGRMGKLLGKWFGH